MIKVACALIVKEDKVLVAQRSERMQQPLKWEFPGGKVEPYETPEQCIVREIREELGIEINLIKSLDSYLYSYDTFKIQLLPFVAQYLSGQVYLSEHKAYLWLPKEALKSLDWSLADVPLVNDWIKH